MAEILDVYRTDQLIDRSAFATEQTVPLRKVYERALPCAPATSHRHFNGDKGSPAAIMIAQAVRLAKAGINFWPILSQVVAAYVEERYLGMDTAELERLIDMISRAEHRTEAEENLQTTHPTSHRAAAEADCSEASLQLERAALHFILDLREQAENRASAARRERLS